MWCVPSLWTPNGKPNPFSGLSALKNVISAAVPAVLALDSGVRRDVLLVVTHDCLYLIQPTDGTILRYLQYGWIREVLWDPLYDAGVVSCDVKDHYDVCLQRSALVREGVERLSAEGNNYTDGRCSLFDALQQVSRLSSILRLLKGVEGPTVDGPLGAAGDEFPTATSRASGAALSSSNHSDPVFLLAEGGSFDRPQCCSTPHSAERAWCETPLSAAVMDSYFLLQEQHQIAATLLQRRRELRQSNTPTGEVVFLKPPAPETGSHTREQQGGARGRQRRGTITNFFSRLGGGSSGSSSTVDVHGVAAPPNLPPVNMNRVDLAWWWTKFNFRKPANYILSMPTVCIGGELLNGDPAMAEHVRERDEAAYYQREDADAKLWWSDEEVRVRAQKPLFCGARNEAFHGSYRVSSGTAEERSSSRRTDGNNNESDDEGTILTNSSVDEPAFRPLPDTATTAPFLPPPVAPSSSSSTSGAGVADTAAAAAARQESTSSSAPPPDNASVAATTMSSAMLFGRGATNNDVEWTSSFILVDTPSVFDAGIQWDPLPDPPPRGPEDEQPVSLTADEECVWWRIQAKTLRAQYFGMRRELEELRAEVDKAKVKEKESTERLHYHGSRGELLGATKKNPFYFQTRVRSAQ